MLAVLSPDARIDAAARRWLAYRLYGEPATARFDSRRRRGRGLIALVAVAIPWGGGYISAARRGGARPAAVRGGRTGRNCPP